MELREVPNGELELQSSTPQAGSSGANCKLEHECSFGQHISLDQQLTHMHATTPPFPPKNLKEHQTQNFVEEEA